jgi:hypothetical protein
MKKFHLAQINIAQGKAPLDSEIMKGFADRINDINTLAETSPGFVWRFKTAEGYATNIQAFDDPSNIVNMSVWEDLESLRNYVYKSLHVELIRDRETWFHKMGNVHQVLWWIPVGHTLSLKEGKEKLDFLQENGPSLAAFTFAKNFPHDD